MVLARAPVLAAVVRTVALLLAAAPGPPLAPVEGVAPARSIAVTHLGPNGLEIEKETTHCEMDTSRVDGVKAPQHRGTPRCACSRS